MEAAENTLEMYVEYRGEHPVKYAYGEPWVAMAMYVDGYGFPTPEEAMDAWRKENERRSL